MKVLFESPNNLFNRLIWRLLPDCKKIVALASQSLDRKLSMRERITMKLHLITCAGCLRFFKQSKFLSRAMSEYYERCSVDESEINVSEEARERLKAAVNRAKSGVT
ncbi:MAG: zf-HC2 domain-containing protein [Pyrinomonadaceae bacterium]